MTQGEVMMNKLPTMLLLAGSAAAIGSAGASDLVLRAGVHNVDPKSDNNAVVHVDSNATLSLAAEWYFTKNVALDVLGSVPFKHDIRLNSDNSKVASIKHLPPTISLQYHFNPGGGFDPYLGAGVNYTLIFDKQTTGALAGTKLSVENSFGPAVQAGGDFALGKDWLLGIDVRYIWIKAKASVNGASIGDVKVDPLVYGVSIGRRFSL
jgi:outer membrane protein